MARRLRRRHARGRRSGAGLICAWALLGCAARPPEVIRLPPQELVVGPSYDPMLVWPTSPPAAVDAFALDRKSTRASPWPPRIDYCIDPSGRVTTVRVHGEDREGTIADHARGWTFAPWEGPSDARFCEAALIHHARRRTRRSRSMIVVYLPIVPPVAPLPVDHALDVVPARLVHTQHSKLWAFWRSAQRGIEPGFGEVRREVCSGPDGVGFTRESHTALDWLPAARQEQLAHPLGYNAWRFAPRLEGGRAVNDCTIEVRYAVWVLDAGSLRYHEDLYRHLNVDGQGFGFALEADLTPEAVHDEILGVDGAPAPTMIRAPDWVPPYELVATMPRTRPADAPPWRIRVRFCVPAAGGHPSEIRVVESDVPEPEQGVHRLVAEGVARWRAAPGDEARCGEVDWRLGWRRRDIPDPRRRR